MISLLYQAFIVKTRDFTFPKRKNSPIPTPRQQGCSEEMCVSHANSLSSSNFHGLRKSSVRADKNTHALKSYKCLYFQNFGYCCWSCFPSFPVDKSLSAGIIATVCKLWKLEGSCSRKQKYKGERIPTPWHINPDELK